MRRRLVVITEIIAPYRIPVFNALAKLSDVDLHVIFLSETDASLRQWSIYKEEIQFSYEVLPAWRARLSRHNFLLNRGVSRALSKCDPDIVVCGGYSYVASWQALAWAKWRRTPFVLWTESTGRDQRRALPPIEIAKRSFIRACDGFLVPGKASLNYLVSLGASVDRVFVAPNAVDVARFTLAAELAKNDAEAIRADLQLPTRFFLFVGRLVPAKGIFDFCEAYSQLPADLRREVGLVYVGDGAARSELERRATTVTPGSIRVVGFTQRDDLANFYALAQALVLPTHSDTWGLVVNEAMACGLPIITTDVAGCAEDLVHHGENGFLVPPRNVGGLADAMTLLALDTGLARNMGRRSSELIANYSPEKCAAGFASIRFTPAAGEANWKPIA
jgi:glycosyltransferase involved in cell wall biosynthesis